MISTIPSSLDSLMMSKVSDSVSPVAIVISLTWFPSNEIAAFSDRSSIVKSNGAPKGIDTLAAESDPGTRVNRIGTFKYGTVSPVRMKLSSLSSPPSNPSGRSVRLCPSMTIARRLVKPLKRPAVIEASRT